jgi:hypothetical protein
LVSSVASAQTVDILDQNLLKTTCASQIASLPIDVIVPTDRYDVIVHPRNPGGEDVGTCANYSWVKIVGKVSSASIKWNGRTTTSAYDCSHSTMTWGLYQKYGSNWSWVGGGGSYGKMPGNVDGGPCNYDMSGVPHGWGAFTTTTGGSSSSVVEYRMAFKLWSHDDESIGHASYCADPINCFWPLHLTLGGSPQPKPKQDYTLWRPSSGTWYRWDTTTNKAATPVVWGKNGDWPLPGDYDGDGNTDFAYTHISGSTRQWWVINSWTGSSWGVNWGSSSDVPIVNADYDGDGRTDPAVYNTTTGQFSILKSNTGAAWYPKMGGLGTQAVGGNYDADLRTDLAVWTASSGKWEIDMSVKGPGFYFWGIPGDFPVIGDFDGDEIGDVAVWRPSEGMFYFLSSLYGGGYKTQWGQNGDWPVVGYYDDDKKSDYAVWRPSEGRWYYIYSRTGSSAWSVYGVSGDVPLAPFARNF